MNGPEILPTLKEVVGRLGVFPELWHLIAAQGFHHGGPSLRVNLQTDGQLTPPTSDFHTVARCARIFSVPV